MDQEDKYLAYVNAYYAIEEALEARLREHAPADGLDAFCRRANPFLWDEEASADRSIYEGFSRDFRGRFDADSSTADEAYDFVRTWLQSLQGGEFGILLLDAFDSVATRDAFVSSFAPLREQIGLRRVVNELTPQDRPEAPATQPPATGSQPATLGDVAQVAALIAPDDVARQGQLADYLRRQLSSAELMQWVYRDGGTIVATAGLIPVTLPPDGSADARTVGLLVLCAGPNDVLDALLEDMRAQGPNWELIA